MILTVVIPALNEEEGVESILRRTLAAREAVACAETGVREIEVILVNDGSTDRTEEIARSVDGVRVLSFAKNRGYGAAIKAGFEAGRGDWLGFLDADGTCEPRFFKDLLALARAEKLDVALGSRMHPGSRMPAVRVLGNWLFRSLVNLIGDASVTDIASGMRVVRREALNRLYPLPDGLHFTPAMSVRALLDPRLRIGEIPMPYEERVGRSKLSVVRDGFRFLGIILQTALAYRPLLFFGAAAALLAAPALALLMLRLGGPTAAPVPFYLSQGYVADWMIFRLLLVAVLGAGAVFSVCLGLVARALVGLINHEPEGFPGLSGRFMALFPLWGALSLLGALFVIRRPLASYLATGEIPPEFWPFPVAAALFAIVGLEFLGFYGVTVIARMLWERERFRRKP